MNRVVIKIGSSSLINSEGFLDKRKILDLIRQISILKENQIGCVIVTSGAIAVGAKRINIKPKDIKMKQACAAIGQGILMHAYEEICDLYQLKCAQILVTHEDFEINNRMLNLKNTLNSLLENDVIPIVNENDALATEEIMVGDNDTLAALISPMAFADRLILLSDIDGLYTDNPKINTHASFIRNIENITPEIEAMAHESTSSVGTGGMMTKIKAAILATNSGIDMIIMNTNKIENLHNAYKDNYEGSLFHAKKR